MTDALRQPVSHALLFQGRPGDPRLGEWVKPIDEIPDRFPMRQSVVLIGCPDDQGVVLNRGRAGAKDGPDSIRKHLYRLTLPMDFEWEGALGFYDFGNSVPASDIVETHQRARSLVTKAVKRGATVILLGGGHDFAAPGILGLLDGSPKAKPALINVDPHLDMRELENGRPHSGTPFRQVLDDGRLKGKQFVSFGARAGRNARSHFEFARSHQVTVDTFEGVRSKRVAVADQFRQHLTRLSKTASTVAVTIDMDSCADCEGISAPPVLGFSAWELTCIAGLAGKEKKVRYLELAEVAPTLDSAERSSRIAAEMIFAFLLERAKTGKARS